MCSHEPQLPTVHNIKMINLHSVILSYDNDGVRIGGHLGKVTAPEPQVRITLIRADTRVISNTVNIFFQLCIFFRL